MIILPIRTTSLIHLSLKGWENVPFEHGNEGLNDCMSMVRVAKPLMSATTGQTSYQQTISQVREM